MASSTFQLHKDKNTTGKIRQGGTYQLKTIVSMPMKPSYRLSFPLLSRDQFRMAVFERDGYRCVICGEPAKDAHHIIERRLFKGEHEKGGYFLENGASLCEVHHIQAETTTLTCDEIRTRCGIERIVLPEHLYSDLNYDKWGNVVTPAGRLKGELYHDESVQKILKGDDFIKYVKYPRTYHVSWSEGTEDDKMLSDDEHFAGKEVIVTVKMDGQNFTGYNDYCHARSTDASSHPSLHVAKEIWFQRAYLLDDDMRVVCENLHAKHTIHYRRLSAYLLVTSVWINDLCLDWEETVEYAGILDLPMPDVIFNGVYDRERIIDSYQQYKKQQIDDVEGYVIRVKDTFRYFHFSRSVAKFVEPAFRRKINDAHGHWMSKRMEENQLDR